MSSFHSHRAPEERTEKKKKRKRDEFVSEADAGAAASKEKKKRKRHRDERVSMPVEIPPEPLADDGAVVKKKKKKPRDSAVELVAAPEIPPGPVVHDDPVVVEKKQKRKRDLAVEVEVSIPSPEPAADGGAVEKKKKKKKNRESVVDIHPPEIPPQPTTDDGAHVKKRRDLAVDLTIPLEIPPEAIADDGAIVEKKKKKHRDAGVESGAGAADIQPAEKRKKRKHREGSSDGIQDAVEAPVDVTPKKKRKHRDEVVEVVALPVDISPKKKRKGREGAGVGQDAVEPPVDVPPKKKRKHRDEDAVEPAADVPPKKSKGKEKVNAPLDYSALQSFISGDPLDASLFPALALDSNDDVLRAIQDLDLTKLGGVDSANVAAPKKISKSKNSSKKKGSSSTGKLLTTKSSKPAKSSSKGVDYRRGKFSAIEVQQVNDAMEHFRAVKGYSHSQIVELLTPGSGKGSELCDAIVSALGTRTRASVGRYLRRHYDPLRAQGAWTAEEDAKLIQAVTSVGQRWSKVTERVGRTGIDCRDRYRNHLEYPNRNVGRWSEEEEEELTQIVLKVTKGKNMDSNELLGDTIPWGEVCRLMGGKRNRQQCRIKWLDTLSRRYKMDGKDRDWAPSDTVIMLERLSQMKDVMHDTEIDWKALPNAEWNLWSPHLIQRNWLNLKRRTPGHENMTYPEFLQLQVAKHCRVLDSDSDEESTESKDSD